MHFGYYGKNFPEGIGKIIRETNSSITIELNERNSLADTETWDKKSIERFNTIEQAVKYWIENIKKGDFSESNLTPQEIKLIASYNFPSYYKN